MSVSEITDLMYQMFVMSVRLAGPILLISMFVGILISVLQAATQIHEQTLTFVPKLVVIGIILVISGGGMLRALQDFARQAILMIAG
ncbi:MAG: flagellar biosynthetic protein FliQ [Lachnospiraceae bacterium]|nr:flagellar biosynthetic protein FliQ [Lachnospiraceae bacterium]